jgi:radical SAM protein with 4Fe4S-binding SPASM domain
MKNMLDFNFKTGWLTINRSCNLRCNWCYAKKTGYNLSDDMKFETAKTIIDIFHDLKIKSIVLIGGEPTLYKNFFDVIDYCHKNEINVSIVTNALQCENDHFIDDLKKHNIKHLSVSFKGESKEAFFKTTNVDAFDRVVNAIKKCINNNIDISVSMVLALDSMKNISDGVKLLKEIGVQRFNFSFCYNFNYNGDSPEYQKPKDLLDEFYKIYDDLDKLLNHRFSLSNGIPLCLWNVDVLEKLIKRKQISTTCQLLKRIGLLFSTDGSLIPCNAMYKLTFGKLGIDFNNAKELIDFFKTEEVQAMYKKLCGLPSKECLECKWMKYCGGGCVCNWTNYDFNSVKEWRSNDDFELFKKN